MKRTQLNFDERTYVQLASYAQKKKVSLSSAVRTLVQKQIAAESKIEKNPLLGLAALGEKLEVKGPKDLSVNHDYYLYVKTYLTPEEKKKKKK